jgi:acetyltransferase-like isoleucine patch superfamily enzyme
MQKHPFRSIWQPLKMLISRLMGPRIVGGFMRFDGQFLANTRLSNHAVLIDRQKLQLSDHVFIGHFSVLDASGGLSIGEGCQISAFVGIFTHSSHCAIRLYGQAYVNTATKAAYFLKPIELGPYSFIGAHCTLLPGTQLGKGSLVFAHSVVKGTFADFAILKGAPAKVVGDTRELDAAWLQAHPELQGFYDDWMN